jgi:endonuclease-3
MAERGCLELSFLADWPVEEALAKLMELPGVGPKVAAAALNFSRLRLRTLVVDTHVWRACQRLGLIGAKVDADTAPQVLMKQVPNAWIADDFTEFHLLLKRLGQDYCPHDGPRCGVCPLDGICPKLPFRPPAHRQGGATSRTFRRLPRKNERRHARRHQAPPPPRR